MSFSVLFQVTTNSEKKQKLSLSHRGTELRTSFANSPLSSVSLCLREKLWWLLFLYVCCAWGASCAPGKFATTGILIERAGKEPVQLKVELARTLEERRQGLMNRKKLPDGEGMLFIFERDEVLSFWMKDTIIPLSIAFISSQGSIIEIKDMRPRDLNSVQSSRSVRYALEVPQGWFGRADVKAGDTVILDY